ncbi:hypothetical protein ColLi_03611 [Colletotrichum liriopes]|uniref:Uncharacterized protein n=1 Tax=Colletotrichum liriopes TaxID=708192 RepID=A0AA37LQX5_9PEZI|nr:hypothetical protein ColLi_03611 [Colletotrichum liriopes]
MHPLTVVTSVFVVFLAAAVVESDSHPGIVNALEASQCDCETNGVAGGQCGEVFEQLDCTGSRVNIVKPDCSQLCNKVTDKRVTSLRVSGDGNIANTVTCYMYSDEGCNAEVRRSNAVSQSWQRQCLNVEGQTVKSWKCLKGC